ncbi:MAG: magnesium chelatase, partial [Candidatus Dormibacteraceae bacterium]
RYLSDELTIHFGLIPRTNRGIFGINELPDLAERIQVGLLNVMEEKDVQIRGYMVRMPLDLMVVASANPEDYTARGRIITPLKDRFGSQVRTHYPSEIEQEITIMEAEAATPPAGIEVYVPPFMKEVVAEITHLARRSPRIAQSSGVSVRMSIGNYENLISNAIRRCLRVREHLAVPRISDLRFLAPSTMGKIEIEALDEGKEGQVLQRIQNSAVAAVFSRHFGAGQFPRLLDYFASGATIESGDGMPSSGYTQSFAASDELEGALKRLHLPDQPATRASLTELVLEGLHLTKRLNKTEAEGGAIYQQ